MWPGAVPWKTLLKSTERNKGHPEGSQKRLFVQGTLCKIVAGIIACILAENPMGATGRGAGHEVV